MMIADRIACAVAAWRKRKSDGEKDKCLKDWWGRKGGGESTPRKYDGLILWLMNRRADLSFGCIKWLKRQRRRLIFRSFFINWCVGFVMTEGNRMLYNGWLPVAAAKCLAWRIGGKRGRVFLVRGVRRLAGMNGMTESDMFRILTD